MSLSKRGRVDFGDIAEVVTNLAPAFAAVSSGMRQRMGSQTATSSRKKTGPDEQGYNFVSRRYRKSGRVRNRNSRQVFKNLIGSGAELITRWQNTSQTYVGPGSISCAWGGGTSEAVQHALPLHMISLSHLGCVTSMGSLNQQEGIYPVGMVQLGYDPTVGAPGYYWQHLVNQTNRMTQNIDGAWQLESYDGTMAEIISSGEPKRLGLKSIFHKWTDIKLNLYGCFDVPVRWHVKLKLIPEELNIFQVGENVRYPDNTPLSGMYNDIVKPLLWSSVNTNSKKDWLKQVKTLKSYDVTIQPCSFSDQRAQHQEVTDAYNIGMAGHIHELRWFLRHDRFRDYAWSHDPFSAGGEKGWDVVVNDKQYNDVDWSKRLYLEISATCAYFDPTGTNPRFTPTYDCNIRNSFVVWPNSYPNPV